MNTLFEKFKEYALTEEQASQVRGGGWSCHDFRNGEYYASVWYSSAESAMAACPGNVQLDGTYCVGCHESNSLETLDTIDSGN